MPSPSTETILKQIVWLLLLGLGLVAAMYYGRVFWLPLAFGGLLALLFLPIIDRLKRWGWPDWLAISACVLLLVLIFGLLVLMVTLQVNVVAEQWPQVQEELQQKGEKIRQFATEELGLSAQRLNGFRDQLSQGSQWLQGIFSNFLGSFFSSLTSVLLTVVYLVFLLMARGRIYRFVLQLLPDHAQDDGRAVMAEAKEVVTNFLGGRLILSASLGTFYAIGFWAFGLPNAFPLAVLAGALSIIPYLGNVIGGAIAIAFGIAMGESLTPLLGVIGTMSVAQVLENNVLQPWIIGNRVSMNPLFTFTTIIAFGLIWGVPGTVIAIPIVGIFLKVCTHVPGWQPIAYLLGQEE